MLANFDQCTDDDDDNDDFDVLRSKVIRETQRSHLNRRRSQIHVELIFH